MYVCTIATQHGPWLFRVDAEVQKSLKGPVNVVHVTRTESSGRETKTVAKIGAGDWGDLLPNMAVAEVIGDLSFACVTGGLNLVHSSPTFTQAEFSEILSAVQTVLTIRQLTTTMTIQ